MTLAQTLLGIIAISPFITALLIALSRNQHYRWLTAVMPFLTLIAVILLLTQFLESEEPIAIVFGELLPGIAIGFKVEIVGLIFACVVALLWPISMLYTLDYLDANQLENPQRLCLFFSLAIGCTLGVAFAGDLLTLLVFYELLTLCTYPLVTHKDNRESRRAGHAYISYLMGSSLLLLLPAIIWTVSAYGTLTFESGGITDNQPFHPVLLALFAFGIGKAALIPMHRWLPAAMAAPVPVSALLHAVAVVKSGVFAIIKIFIYIFGLELPETASADWLVYVAGFSIVIASVIALYQNNLKRRLAYSTVSQLAYITMGAALLKPAIIGAVFHLVAHAFGKITLFFAAGAIQTCTDKHRVSELAGIGRVMPLTMLFFGIAAISIIGLPPAAGFVSKWYLLDGAVQTQHLFIIAVLGVSTLLNAAYFIPIIYRAFAVPPDNLNPDQSYEAPVGMLVAMGLTTAAVIALFFISTSIIRLMQQTL